ncbi:MAG: hypothetical protein IJP75_01955 [Bacteroidaceae bacterium]|nr:hypothetical protein [Bacteroidaceae bacterium]
MRTNKTILFILLLMGMNIGLHAQEGMKENPRGVYKFMNFVGRGGKTYEASEDQYKICTDSMTLTLNVTENYFEFRKRDGDKIFNYTGEEPDVNDPHASRIYNSGDKQFDFKWWSVGYADKPMFPKNDWCIEHYESGMYSKVGKEVVEACMLSNYRDESNPFIGVWQFVATLKNSPSKEDVDQFLEKEGKNDSGRKQYRIVTPSHIFFVDGMKGTAVRIKMNDKNSFEEFFQMGSEMHTIQWLSPDTISVGADHEYLIWVRTAKEKPLLAEMLASGKTRVSTYKNQPDDYEVVCKKYLINVPVALELLEEYPFTLKKKYEKMAKSIKVHGMMIPSSIASNLSLRYVVAQRQQDLQNVYVGYARKRISLKSLQQLNNMYETPQAQQASQHLTQMKKKIRNEVLPQIIKDFVASNGVGAAPVAVSCSESYLATFNEFCRVTSIEKVMMHRFDDLLGSTDKKELKKCKKALPLLSTFMEANMPVVLLNASYDTMTEEDLRELIAIATSPEGKEVSKLNSDFVSEMEKLFVKGEENDVVKKMRERFRQYVQMNTTVEIKTVTRYVPVRRY